MAEMRHESIAAALAAFQAEVPHIAKGNTADVKSKSGASFRYSYADLTDVTQVALPLLASHGLSFTSAPTMTDAGFVLAYKLLHDSGQSIEGAYPLPTGGGPQDVGSAITYARRYALCAVTGIAPGGDDDDAQAAQQVPQPAPPEGWRKLVADAQSMDDLKAIHGRANSEGWAVPDVMKALTARRRQVEGDAGPNA